jgi:hypothetical protein
MQRERKNVPETPEKDPRIRAISDLTGKRI